MISCMKHVLVLGIMVLIMFRHSGFSIDTETINSTLVLKDSDTIHSSGKIFVLGFFSPNGTTNRYVGIWYSVSPETVAWVANRDIPINDSSGTVSLSSDGNIMVMNGQQEIVWSSSIYSPTSSRNTSTRARLMDSGNLVLQDSISGSTVWESFAHPTDTFFPGMGPSDNLRTGVKVVANSWRTFQDPGRGNFTVGISARGVPQGYIWDLRNGTTVPRWRSGPWNGRVFTGIERPDPQYFFGFGFTTQHDGTVYISWGAYPGLQRNTLNSSGFLLDEVWNDKKKDWDLSWSVPTYNDCDLYNFCGPFALCYYQSTPFCSCLRGYEPRHTEEWNRGIWRGGCMRSVAFHCERNGTNEGGKDGFWELTYIKVPDFMQRTQGFEAECEDICLGNCSCLAYAYDLGIGCMFWTETLLDVQKFRVEDNAGMNLYVRVPYSKLDKKNRSLVFILLGIWGVIAALLCLLGAWWICKRKGAKAKSDDMDKISIEELPLFSFEMLAIATNNFYMENKLGMGGFGPVFKGKLAYDTEIAVKRLCVSSGQGLEEFMNEVIVISKLQHRNLVRLLGCCVEKKEKMLVYEYVQNRSLDVFLFDKTQNVLDWKKRFNIIQGIGRGLLYLHRDSRLRIIHRDLKPNNILLDKEWNPKISDFGMARIFGGNQDQANTKKIVGTCGYMAPEYVLRGMFSEKSDVFSFGVIMLEIISGRKNTSFYDDESSLSLLAHAWKLWNEDKAIDLIDNRISHPSLRREIVRCTHIGLLCVQEAHGQRPTISNVLSMLSREIVDLPVTGRPGFTENWHVGSSHSLAESANGLTLTMLEGR